MTTEEFITKIILETATGEDFSFLGYDFGKSSLFFNRSDVVSILEAFDIDIYIASDVISLAKNGFSTYYICTYTGAYAVSLRKNMLYDARGI